MNNDEVIAVLREVVGYMRAGYKADNVFVQKVLERADTAIADCPWQPISTAPRGVSVLCYWPAIRTNDVAYEAYISQAWQRFGNWFTTRDGYGAPTNEVNEPTHWQPLPSTP